MTRYLRYQLTLRAPLLVTRHDGDPNSARTASYLPGSAIRGAVAAALLRRGEDAGGARFRRLVLDGGVRYLHCYLEVDGGRGVPVPLSWRPEKHGDEGRLHDLAAVGSLCDWPKVPLAAAPRGVVRIDAAELVRDEVRTDARLHHQRDRRAGRPGASANQDGEPAGAVFVLEALSPGQRLRGVIAVDEEPERTLGELRELLVDGARFGRSRRAGYGGDVVVRWDDDAADRELADGGRLLEGGLAEGDLATILLTSEYLGRDPRTGQHDPGQLIEELERRLPGAAEVRRCWAATELGGYNRRWGMPLPKAPVLAAGSVVVVEARAPISEEALSALEHRGLGERRGDGFGRVALLRAPSAVVGVGRPGREAPQAPAAAVPEAGRLLERRLAWAAVEREATTLAARVVAGAERLPLPSLLARLQAPLRAGADGLPVLREWLGDGQGGGTLRAPARRQLDRCRVRLEQRDGGSTTLLRWLAERAKAELPAVEARRWTLDGSDHLTRWLGDDERRRRIAVLQLGTTLAQLRRRSAASERG